MKKFMAAAIAALVLSASPAHALVAGGHFTRPQMMSQQEKERGASNGYNCDDTRPRCDHVAYVIRQVFPSNTQEWAVACFASESGLTKWANANNSSQYKGFAQMGSSERQATGWKWRVLRQAEAAERWLNGSGQDAWTAPAC